MPQLFTNFFFRIFEYELRDIFLWSMTCQQGTYEMEHTRKYPKLNESGVFNISSWFNTLRPRQNGRHFADDTFKYIFLNKNVIISAKISLKFVPKGPINNITALVQIMAWRRSGVKPISEPMMVRLPTHICVTRPQWVKPRLIFTAWGLWASG